MFSLGRCVRCQHVQKDVLWLNPEGENENEMAEEMAMMIDAPRLRRGPAADLA